MDKKWSKWFNRRGLSYIERKAVADFIKSAHDGGAINDIIFERLRLNLGWVYHSSGTKGEK